MSNLILMEDSKCVELLLENGYNMAYNDNQTVIDALCCVTNKELFSKLL